MKTYNSSGDIVKTIADQAYESDDFVTIGAVNGFVVDKCAEGEYVVIKTQGVFELTLPAGVDFGDIVYHGAAGFASAAGEGITRVGVCVGPNLLKLD